MFDQASLVNMAQMKPAVAMVSENAAKCEAMRMQICSVPSVQRVVNFTVDDGKMYFGEQFGGIVPEVSTISELPLLFVNGSPSRLEKLTLEQMETFIPYMIECSAGTCDLKAAPKWWPSNVEFSARPQRPSDLPKSDWFKCLKIIVSNCYSYHGCEFAVSSSRYKTSFAWPNLNDIYNKSSALMPNKSICFRNNVDVKPHLRRYNGDAGAPERSQLLCAVCGTKFRRAQEIRRHKKSCLPTSDSIKPQHLTDYNRVSAFNLRAQDVRTTLNNNCSSTHRNKRIRKDTSTENIPTRAIQVKLTDIKWLPHIVLRDCMKGSFKRSNQSSPYPTRAKQRPLSSLNGERVIRDNLNKDNIPTLRRKNKIAKRSLLPEVAKKAKTPIILTEETRDYDACGVEFLSSEVNKAHVALPSDLPPEPRYDVVQTQDTFMNYFGLIDSSTPFKQDNNNVRTLRNPIKYSGVPISSPLGNLIFGRSRVSVSVFLAKIEKVERYCLAKPQSGPFPLKVEMPSSSRWEVSWKEKATGDCDHHYLYPLKRWWQSPVVWEKEMKRRIEYLKKIKLCKPCHVVLRRLNAKEIERFDSSRAKVTFQAKKSLKMTFTMVPKVKRLTQKEVDAYTNVIAPMLRRLTDQEIKKYSK